MKKSDQLKLERTAKLEAQGVLLSKAKTENRDLTPEELSSFDALGNEVDDFDVKIERAVKMEAAELRIAAISGTPVGEPAVVREEKPVFSIHRAIQSQMTNGKLEGAELEMHNRTVKSAEKSGIAIGGMAIALQSRATAQTVTGDSGGAGGNLVATELQAPIDALRPEPLMEKIGATYLRGLNGNLKFPKNAGGIVATWEGETDTVDPTANLYGYVEMTPKRLSVTVPISLQNLLQSSIDLEMYTINQINLAIANAMDLAAVNGSGTGQPLGILGASGVNTVATATNGSAPTWDFLVDAETKVFVENANAAKMNYLVNPQTRGTLKKTKHAAGDLNYLMSTADNTVNGYPSATSNHVPANLTKGSGSNLSALVFGDFSQLLIGQWGFMDLSVDDKSRKKDGIVEVTVNVFADVLVKQPKAFTKIVGLITA
jgi:HK97 family phage major capsid protein